MRIAFCLFLLLATSCCAPNKEAMESLEANWALLYPATVRGISTDPDLSEKSKETRLRNVEEFTLLVEEINNAAR
ncbi:MAG TPA: hypothetical protein VGK73_03010 [Polyangiaceae bacterium]